MAVTVIGIDDTDSRERGMCTTWVAAGLADRLGEATVDRPLLVRLNPAVEHKTRGNAALAVHADAPVERCLPLVEDALAAAETADPATNPGAVVAPGSPSDVPEPVAAFARRALREHLAIDEAVDLASEAGYRTLARGNGRGRIGALAAVGSRRAFEEWTYERIAYREPERWGTDRTVDRASVFAAAEAGYPAVWDTVDRAEGTAVCVPRTPGPVLYGIRGDDPASVRAVADAIESEPVAGATTFATNQGTDAHLATAPMADLRPGRSYRVDGTVDSPPETREGGHVFLALADGEARVACAAFEPTKRFRDRVRALEEGDRLTACGEFTDRRPTGFGAGVAGTLKLEKFAVRDLRTTESVTPDCPDCGRSMASAGADQGYRCRRCDTAAPGRVDRDLDRDIDLGWYEVPPVARRHVARPLVRGGFDAPVHPER